MVPPSLWILLILVIVHGGAGALLPVPLLPLHLGVRLLPTFSHLQSAVLLSSYFDNISDHAELAKIKNTSRDLKF
jgi:hypothetical protein